jgi:hypothetical protein
MLHRRPLALALALASLSVPTSALAASATQSGYDDTNDVKVTKDKSTTSPTKATAKATPAATTASSLPFTGLEAGLIGVAGLGLAGTGLFLRRAAREEL